MVEKILCAVQFVKFVKFVKFVVKKKGVRYFVKFVKFVVEKTVRSLIRVIS